MPEPAGRARPAYAVCPRVERNDPSLSPSLFRTESAAKRFLKKTRGWGKLVPFSRKADDAGPECPRTLRKFLSAAAVDFAPPLTYDEAFDLFIEMGGPDDFTCYLDDDWCFKEIDADARMRGGHQIRPDLSIAEIVVGALYDLEDAFQYRHPRASCRAVADFWCSWQIQQHVADYCFKLGGSSVAARLASDPVASANEARELVYRRLGAFAHELSHTLIHPVADTMPEAIVTGSGDPPQAANLGIGEMAAATAALKPKPRGRPQTIPDDLKDEALKAKDGGGTNRDAAKIIYQTNRPSPQQVKNVSTILREHVKKLKKP